MACLTGHSAIIVPASWGAFYKKGLWMVKESARKFLVARFSGDNFWWGWEKIVILLLKAYLITGKSELWWLMRC